MIRETIVTKEIELNPDRAYVIKKKNEDTYLAIISDNIITISENYDVIITDEQQTKTVKIPNI